MTSFFVRALVILSLSIVFLVWLSINNGYYAYFPVFFLIILSLIYLLKTAGIYMGSHFFIPCIFLFAWLVGIANGVLHGNTLTYIIHNFSGMCLYVFYFILPSRLISPGLVYRIFKVCVLGSVMILVYIALNKGLLTINNLHYIFTDPLNFNRHIHYQVGVYLPVAMSFIIVFMARTNYGVKFYRLFIGGLLLLLIFLLLALVASKSLWLVCFINLCFIFYIFLEGRAKRSIFNYTIFIVCMVGVFSILCIMFYVIAGHHLSGNAIRWAQFRSVFNNVSFFGYGLGATLIDYTANANTYNQEFEYVNLINQFGLLLGVTLCFCYLYTLYKAFRIRVIDKTLSIICFSFVSFIFMGIGDPVLFAPVYVILHCFVLRTYDNPTCVRFLYEQSKKLGLCCKINNKEE